MKALLVNLGVRMESTRQWVKYYNDGGMEMRRDLNTDEFFPALNLKYTFDKKNSLRLAASRTVTRLHLSRWLLSFIRSLMAAPKYVVMKTWTTVTTTT